ncbi:DUF4160 domain-containing protein [Brevibacillus sp. 179-C9.3 HS]|uniref:DUF4160 domain-containing protein n=1 Tax=unclassified Brevibacillus TaxID=2684853 RepID=UPI0039A27B19
MTKPMSNAEHDDFEEVLQELEEGLNFEENSEWEQLPEDFFPLTLDKIEGFFFELRTKENNHQLPHFHVKKAEYEGSFAIYPAKKLSSNFTKRHNQFILDWAEKNQRMLIEKWNAIHPSKKIQV